MTDRPTTIWKYPLPTPGSASIVDLPGPVRVTHVGLDPTGQACVWIEVTPDSGPVQACLSVWATGSPITVAEDLETFRRWHTGSWVDGQYVWHLTVHLGRRTGGVVNANRAVVMSEKPAAHPATVAAIEARIATNLRLRQETA